MNENKYSDLLEKEKNRVELNRAIEATPIGRIYRRYFFLMMLAVYGGGYYLYSTGRLPKWAASANIPGFESSAKSALQNPLSSVLALKEKLSRPQQLPDDPDAAVAQQLAKETAAPAVAPSAGAGLDDDAEIAAHRAKSLSISQQMEALQKKVGAGDAADILGVNLEKAKDAVAGATAKPEGPSGISNGEEDAPTLVYPEGAGLGDPAYRMVNRLPSAYVNEAQEFPDIPR